MLILLGDYYGTVPKISTIEKCLADHHIPRPDNSASMSVTQFEIEYGIFTKNAQTAVNSICCFRDLDTHSYFHTSNEDHQQIEHLKGRLLERADVFCMEYKADWNPEIGQTVGLEDLESYYSQSFHSHAQKQPAKLSADAAHLDFLLMCVK